ncbi:MAG: hypothetical protein ABH950_05820 [Candidatus Altiarchaeota archaeon]
MFVFGKQRLVNIAGVKVGGQVNVPCCLISTIFYERESLFLDNEEKRFDEKKAEKLIFAQGAGG